MADCHIVADDNMRWHIRAANTLEAFSCRHKASNRNERGRIRSNIRTLRKSRPQGAIAGSWEKTPRIGI